MSVGWQAASHPSKLSNKLLYLRDGDLLGQLHMLPHRDKSDKSNFLSHTLCTETRPTSPSTDPVTPGT